ncbi:MAG: hypothetical protein ACI4KF_03735 [Huintestinicola sp.]
MKKARIILALSMAMCLLAACGSTPSSEVTDSSKPSQSAQPSEVADSSEPSQSVQPSDAADSTESEEPSQGAAESTQTDVLYAVFGAEDVREYPLEYTGDKKTAEELANELSGLTGLDFNITASKTDDGLIVDWAADSTLRAGLDDRVQKDEFFFFDHDTLSWFMMDSLWYTLTENLNAENIYYTMDGGKELFSEELYPVHEIPSDVPYMGSDFYAAHSDVQGDEENPYACTAGMWRLDGATDTASIEMDGFGVFTMYYASGSVEATGYLEYVDEYEDGNYRYDCYNADGECLVSFYFDSDTQIHVGNDEGTVYILDTQSAMQAAYLGFWEYDDGTILEIDGKIWNTYESGESTPFAGGPVEYDEEAAYLMNEDGSSGGGKVSFDDSGYLKDGDNVLTYLGSSFDDVPKG